MHDRAAARAAARAVAEGELDAVVHGDDVTIALHLDVIAVQAEHHAVDGFPCAVDCNALGQVVVALLGDLIQTGNRLPCLLAMIGSVLARLAADGVIVQTVVEVDDIAGGDGILLARRHLEAVVTPVVSEEIAIVVSARRVRVRAKLGDRGMFARGNHSVVHPHADLGCCIQTVIADVEGYCLRRATAGRYIDITIRTARVLIARNVHLAGAEQAVRRCIIHAAAVFGAVPGDLAAVHIECAAHIHAAAILCGVVGDRAAVHLKRTLFYVHAAAAN